MDAKSASIHVDCKFAALIHAKTIGLLKKTKM